jgi:hypothetical protein
MASANSPHNSNNGTITKEWVLSEILLEEDEASPNTEYIEDLLKYKLFFCGPDYELC